MQRLTTRQPEDDQIEVAITAMGAAVAADAGRSYASPFAALPASADSSAPPTASEAGSTEAEPAGQESDDPDGESGTSVETTLKP
jgi:hypothetical protein